MKKGKILKVGTIVQNEESEIHISNWSVQGKLDACVVIGSGIDDLRIGGYTYEELKPYMNGERKLEVLKNRIAYAPKQIWRYLRNKVYRMLWKLKYKWN